MARLSQISGVCLAGMVLASEACATLDFVGTISSCLDAPCPSPGTDLRRDAAREGWRQTAGSMGWSTIADLSEAENLPRVAEKAAESDMPIPAYLASMDAAGFAIADPDLIEATIPLSRHNGASTMRLVVPEALLETFLPQSLRSGRLDGRIFAFRGDGAFVFLSGRDAFSGLASVEDARKRECILATLLPDTVISDETVVQVLDDNFVTETEQASPMFDRRSHSHLPQSAKEESAVQLVWSSARLEKYPDLHPDARAMLLVTSHPETSQ